MIEQPIKEGQLFTGNGKDFRVHEIRDGQVWGVLYYTKDRGHLDAETCDFEFIRQPIDVFVQNDAELVAE